MSERCAVATPFEEALNKTGNGIYNIVLSGTCALILLAIGVDLFGFTLVVTAACDLQLTVSEKGILTSLPFCGILLSSYPWGYISDTRGRRFSLIISLQISFILSCISSLSTHWIVLGVMKFLSVCFSCAANSATYTLVGESCVQRVRNKHMLLMTCLLILSPGIAAVLSYPTLKLNFAVAVPWLGIVYRPWRLLLVILSLPLGVGGFLICFLYESPKFLANRGRKTEAIEVLKMIYSANNRRHKDDYMVTTLAVDTTTHKDMSLCKAMYEQSAPLFRPPLLWRTVQLFYLVAVVYITNNSFLMWLPHILNLVRVALESNSTAPGNICSLVMNEDQYLNQTIYSYEESNKSLLSNNTWNGTVELGPKPCLGTVEDNIIFTLITSQSVFAILNFCISYLPNRRKAVLLSTLFLSSLSGVLLNLISEPVTSVLFFVLFTCTCLAMGILASYFVDLYPTSYRGMVACLSIMVGRLNTFVGINLVGNILFSHCQLTFYLWSLLVFSSVVVAWFLPPDKLPQKSQATAL